MVEAIKIKTSMHGKSDQDDDDDVNVDVNAAAGESQYMSIAAVSNVESNQADKEDKGGDSADEDQPKQSKPKK